MDKDAIVASEIITSEDFMSNNILACLKPCKNFITKVSL